MPDSPKPDFKDGFPVNTLPDGGMVAGQLDGEDVLLARRGDEFFAVGAFCTHYHGPLADGLLVGETVRCPWHHAHFSLQTGEALAAPALSPLTCWQIDERDGKITVKSRKAPPPSKKAGPANERF